MKKNSRQSGGAKSGTRRRTLWGVLLAAASMLLSGYVVQTLENRTHTAWPAGGFPVRMQIWEGFGSQPPSLVAGSNPKLALREALDQWARLSSLTIVLGPDTPVQEGGRDNVNVITIADTTNNRNLVGSALGVSLSRFFSSGDVVENDVVFNPGRTFSTVESEEPGISNLFDVAVHELGHSWNLNHTIHRSSTMHAQTRGFSFGFNEPAWDDIAGINISYPLVGIREISGTISGRVTLEGTPVFGAFVIAVDEHGVLVASTITLPDGAYRLEMLPPGKYTLYVEPLDGPITTPNSISGGIFSSAPMTTDFLPRFHNDSMTPSVTVSSDVSGIDFAVVRGNSAVDPVFVGTVDNASSGFGISTSPAEAFQGTNTHIIVGAGNGVNTLLDDQGVFFLGPHLRTGRVARTEGAQQDVKLYPLTIPAEAPKGPRSIFVQKNPEVGVITGGLEIFSPRRFLQAFAQFAHVPNTTSSGVFLINANLSRSASGRILARSDGGTATPVPIGTLAPDGTGAVAFSLNPGGSLSHRSGGGSPFVGSLRVEADRSVGGTVLFEASSGTTGVGSSRPLYSFIAPIEVAGGGGAADTGLAITNLDDRPAKIYLRVQDKAGAPVASAVIDLAANGQIARFIRQLIAALPGDFQGTVVATANRKIAATVIRTSPGIFTTFPVVQNRVSTRSFYAQLAHAGDLTSELLLVNPSPLRQASAQIQVRGSDGNPAQVTL
ncbi:MAG: carboxypeptidase regulatory-like domain-containing protein, partial [Acidobacteria bacterium]|nr:carboxypeptidase regulatory-like domain-containing protein [Acidobacteriota bacterium]